MIYLIIIAVLLFIWWIRPVSVHRADQVAYAADGTLFEIRDGHLIIDNKPVQSSRKFRAVAPWTKHKWYWLDEDGAVWFFTHCIKHGLPWPVREISIYDDLLWALDCHGTVWCRGTEGPASWTRCLDDARSIHANGWAMATAVNNKGQAMNTINAGRTWQQVATYPRPLHRLIIGPHQSIVAIFKDNSMTINGTIVPGRWRHATVCEKKCAAVDEIGRVHIF